MSKTHDVCDYADCEKPSHTTKGPCSMHYYREKRQLEVSKRDALKHVDGRKRDNIDYNDFWLFVKKHVLWDGEGRPIGVKAGLNYDWKK